MRLLCLCALVLSARFCLNGQVVPPDAPAAEVLEEKLKTDPNNVADRRALIVAYSQNGNAAGHDRQILWLIGNLPESSLLGTFGSVMNSGASAYDQAAAAWEVQLNSHAGSPKVVYNAAVFLVARDPARAIDLLEQDRRADPQNDVYVQREALAYRMAFIRDADGKPAPPISTESADQLKARLLDSSDAELLSTTGRSLTDAPDAETKKVGRTLMERAVSLDPSNPKWQAALKSVSKTESPRVVRVGGQVAQANLIQRVDPSYPELARSAGVTGSVEFVATIDGTGSVQSLQLVRGHPLLVNAAKQAVSQWKYRPWTIGGKPLVVITSIVVNFNLKP